MPRSDPERLREQIAEAREIADPVERAARLYALGVALFEHEEAPLETVGEAMAALHEAMTLGSAHAALELGRLWLADASTPEDLRGALALIERAAEADLVEAQLLLGEILRESPATCAAGERWLARAAAGSA